MLTAETTVFKETWSAETASKPSSHRLVSGKTSSQPFVGTPAQLGGGASRGVSTMRADRTPVSASNSSRAAEIQWPYVTINLCGNQPVRRVLSAMALNAS